MLNLRISRAGLLLAVVLCASFLSGCETVEPDPVVIDTNPETRILDGEADWTHPTDPEIYPYYIQLNDPAQIHHPFASGDRIPDRTYVVIKALARNEEQAGKQDGDLEIGISGFIQGERQNFSGGVFSFASDTSELNMAPAWPALCDTCWVADTLGFLTAPSSEFTINMQGVDGDGVRDSTPASLSFHVGYPPCLQCIEILPKSSSVSAWTPALACVDDAATHPCFQDQTVLRVPNPSAGIPGPDALELKEPVVMWVDRQTYVVRLGDVIPDLSETHFRIDANIYTMSVLLHGRDDPREAWAEPVRRTLGWAYEIGYECDVFNQIQDGGGNDNLKVPTWGEPGDGVGLTIDRTSGLWRLEVEVAVPDQLFLGEFLYRLILASPAAGGSQEIGDKIFDATTKQFGNGLVRAIALDQTACPFEPARPATYNLFGSVRPPTAGPPSGQTWRDCELNLEDIKSQLSLADGAMASNGNAPLTKQFRIVIETNTGDFTPECGLR